MSLFRYGIEKAKNGLKQMRNRTDFSGKTWKRGRSAAKRTTACQAKMSIFVYFTLLLLYSELAVGGLREL